MGDDDNGTVWFSLLFRPTPDLIPLVREFVGQFYQGILANQSQADMLAMATNELLENIAKYSTDGRAQLSVRVKQDPGGLITLQTRNRASERNIGIVQDMFEQRARAKTAAEYYQSLMRNNAKRRDVSGLGLARIMAEAGMDLRCEVESNELCLSGTSHVIPGGAT